MESTSAPPMPDDHLAVEHARRAGDEVEHRCRSTVTTLQTGLPVVASIAISRPSVRADVDLALPPGDAADPQPLPQLASRHRGHLGVVGPQQLARRRVDGMHDAVAGREIEDAVDRDRLRDADCRRRDRSTRRGRAGRRCARRSASAGCNAARRRCGRTRPSSRDRRRGPRPLLRIRSWPRQPPPGRTQ